VTDHITEYTEGHIVRSYDAELDRLRTILLEMGGLVVDQIGLAVGALIDGDPERAKTVLEREEEVNRYDTETEELVLQLLALRQPMGMDLRVIVAVMRAVIDLERCGDEAKKIAKIARRLAQEERGDLEGLEISARSMATLAAGLLKEVIEALDDADISRAVRAAQADADIDAEYKAALQAVHARLIEAPARMAHAAEMIIVIKALERIGDHAKNIAKYVIFIVEGKDVRHVKTAVLDQEV